MWPLRLEGKQTCSRQLSPGKRTSKLSGLSSERQPEQTTWEGFMRVGWGCCWVTKGLHGASRGSFISYDRGTLTFFRLPSESEMVRCVTKRHLKNTKPATWLIAQKQNKLGFPSVVLLGRKMEEFGKDQFCNSFQIPIHELFWFSFQCFWVAKVIILKIKYSWDQLCFCRAGKNPTFFSQNKVHNLELQP